MAQETTPTPEEAQPQTWFWVQVFFEERTVAPLLDRTALRRLDMLAKEQGFTNRRLFDHTSADGRLLKVFEFNTAAINHEQSFLAVTGRAMISLHDWFGEMSSTDQLIIDRADVLQRLPGQESGSDTRTSYTLEANAFLALLDTPIPNTPPH